VWGEELSHPVCKIVALVPHLMSGLLCKADFSPGRMRRQDMPVGLRRSDLCPGLFHNPCWETVSGGRSRLLYTSSYDFRSAPNLQLLEQGFVCRLADFRLSLVPRYAKQGNFVACPEHRSCGFCKQRERICSRESRENDR
jgi:hypothetical protein